MRLYLQSLTLGALLAAAATSLAAESPAEKQSRLIRVVQSEAGYPEKALACKQLAIFGGREAVPALAALLPDENLNSWARIALEAIPDADASEALRAALGKVRGLNLVGVINSIGFRHDAGAVQPLLPLLQDADAEVASAAAAALGRIGGQAPARALEQLLASAPAGTREAVAEGCILCAEKYLAGGDFTAAARLYDAVRASSASKQRLLEAMRGAILARKNDGIPLLLEQLRSADKSFFSIGLRTARELPGGQVTRALAAELDKFIPERQAVLFMALTDRKDEAVAPLVATMAQSGPKSLRLIAISALDRAGQVSTLPLLLQAMAEADAELAAAGKGAVARLSGQEVDAEIIARLADTAGKMRAALIELAAQRRLEAALPRILPCAEDSEAVVRSAAAAAIGSLGSDSHIPVLVGLLQKAGSAKDRSDLEKALVAVSSRAGAKAVASLAPLVKSTSAELRVIALHALAGVGGPEALGIVKATASDADDALQDEAVNMLSTWANNWPDDAGLADSLLALAKSGKKTSHKLLALRGYLECIQGDTKLKDAEKVSSLKEALPLVTRIEEKRQAISVLGAIPAAGAVDLLEAFARDASVTEEACLSLAGIATKRGVAGDLRRKALQTVVDNTKNEATRKKAADALQRAK